ncbi:hypothetical protein LWF15_04705 [Kineosporia rhizophila]|uniref:hypothetical protein n=1 Tax=Kineosporia rhizophila TaxID=84633 RepID=UPI001E409968|nr:hypothetical protein [Kineosporia rhizophila]MCE0534801.1 hypothetical protein [Kineosporia rhizophila]
MEQALEARHESFGSDSGTREIFSAMMMGLFEVIEFFAVPEKYEQAVRIPAAPTCGGGLSDAPVA